MTQHIFILDKISLILLCCGELNLFPFPLY